MIRFYIHFLQQTKICLNTKNLNYSKYEDTCPHTQVNNWICKDCNNKVSQFGCIFDNFEGKVKTFMKVVFENDFLEDFQNALINEQDEENEVTQENQYFSNEDLNDDSNKETEQQQQTVYALSEIIYQQYQPSNSTELREYMLFLISKRIRKLNKQRISILGQGSVSNLSSKLIKYLTENETIQKKLLVKYNNDLLLFDSIFESGNLLQAEMLTPNEYQLYMQVDTNTRGHQQWFYFRVRNTRADRVYTFRIMNFTKPGLVSSQSSGANNNNNANNSQANTGSNNQTSQNNGNVQNVNSNINPLTVQPSSNNLIGQNKKNDHLQKLHYKSKLSSERSWRVIDSDQIEFVKTGVQRKRKDILAAANDSDLDEGNEGGAENENIDNANSQKFLNKKQPGMKKKKPQFYYAMQFEVRFEQNNDTVYFAYALPYTLTDIALDIYTKEQQIAQSNGSNNYYRTQNTQDSDPGSNNNQQQNTPQSETRVAQTNNSITIEAPSKSIFYKREELVHAAETPGSYVFEGIYRFLTSSQQEAKYLRKFYTFIIVPTLNPDGVVCGNYRSSIAGIDLNRQWIQPEEEFQPEIFYIKQLMRFKVEPYKLGTGRVVAWKQFMITHSFTLENSFYGYDFGEDQHKLFTESDYNEVGIKLCQSIFDLHFLWKSIRNELKLTNGWLKPRKLIEITGVPAAQLLNEELLRKKKEDQKKKAIEQYEQFLKRYYNKQDTNKEKKEDKDGITQQRRGSKNLQILPVQNFQFKSENAIIVPQKTLKASNQQQQQLTTIAHQSSILKSTVQVEVSKSRNRDLIQNNSESYQNIALNEEEKSGVAQPEENEMEDLYKLLLGLVKIQARIRGFLTRKKIKSMIPKVKIIRTSKLQSVEKLNNEQTFPIEPIINEAPATVDDMIDNINWRQYFQEQELEEAFQVVEIEKKDDPNDNFSDGSSSNPSLDNFDLKDIYERIYQVGDGEDVQEMREQVNMKFSNEIASQFIIDQQSMLELIEDTMTGGKKSQVSDSNMRSSSYTKNRIHYVKKQGTLKSSFKKQQELNARSTQQQISIIGLPNQNLTPEQLQNKKTSQLNNDPNNKYARRSPYHPQFYNTGLNIDQQILKKSSTQSPMQQEEADQPYPLTTHSIFDPKNLQQIGRNNGQQKSLQGIGNSNTNLNGPQISSIQFKLFQQQQMGNFGKRENIQQVIKDCFITKKIGKDDKTPQKQSAKAMKALVQNQSQLQSAGTQEKLSRQIITSVNDDYEDFSENVTASNEAMVAANLQSNGNVNESSSSLFMKYVKQKLVKKIKTEQITQQVASKYIDIYKELIEKESERKKEEQEFLKNHQMQHILNSRSKIMARSEQKSRHKQKTRQYRTEDQNIHGDNEIHYKTQANERKSMDEPLKQQYSSNGNYQYEVPVADNTFGKNPNRSVYIMENTLDNSYLLDQKLANPIQIQYQNMDTNKVRFPTINNFSSTLEYKKKSRDIINEQKQIKHPSLYQHYQINSNGASSALQAYEFQNFQKGGGSTTAASQIGYQSATHGHHNTLNNNLNYSKVDHSQNSLPLNSEVNLIKFENTKISEIRVQSQKSIDSSIDDDMLDKIKNIYSEIRKNSSASNYQLKQIYAQKQSKIGVMRQKRLLMKGVTNQSNDEQIIIESGILDKKDQRIPKNNHNLNKLSHYQQLNGNNSQLKNSQIGNTSTGYSDRR